MLVNNKKIEINKINSKIKILSETEADFIILNDNTYKNIKHILKIKKLIKKYGYNVKILSLNKLGRCIKKYMKSINLKFEEYTIFTVGIGGKKVFESLRLKLPFFELKWSRIWNNNKSRKFLTNLEKYDFANKKIILIEDVIATGETLFNVISEIEKRGGKIKIIIATIINEGSPLVNKSFKYTLVSKKIKNNKWNKDPYWFPAIYSTRHLFYGDNEMKNFYKIFNEKYFNGSNKIENEIKKMRRK